MSLVRSRYIYRGTIRYFSQKSGNRGKKKRFSPFEKGYVPVNSEGAEVNIEPTKDTKNDQKSNQKARGSNMKKLEIYCIAAFVSSIPLLLYFAPQTKEGEDGMYVRSF